jgi:ABC-type multidrug transport system ATPase subunit/peptidoglycan/LPS O-acetylase OafA/YrhL
MNNPNDPEQRLHALDAVRGFALLLGVAFHATLSFMPGMPPGLWAMNDNSPSAFLADGAFVTHIFRMSLFFFIAGFFGRMLFHKVGARGFWANRSKRILVPMIAGWVVFMPMVIYLWSVGVSKVFNGAPPAMPEFPKVTAAFPLSYFWFLYLLMVLYIAVIAIRALIVRFDVTQRLRNRIDRIVGDSIDMSYGVWFLGLPVAIALMTLPMWFYSMGIPTPDQSLIPTVASLLGFGTAFSFGWLVHRAPGALAAIEKRWWSNLLLAVMATVWMLHQSHLTPMAAPGTIKTLFALAFGVAIWAWVLGLTGAALRFLSGYSAARRYVADASYWIYLAHLPVVVAFQIWVGHWQLHWGVKYPFVLVGSFAVLFLSYHLLVRPSFIGQLLNGRRYRVWGRDPATPAPASPSPAPGNTADGGVVAQLRGITKRYGAVTALADINIEVRRGELLAVLGPNGAGKSTAISLWLGLIEADAGEVSLLGGSPLEIDRRRGLGVMMQDVDMYKDLQVRELVALASSYYATPLDVDETLRRAGVANIADRRYGKLSGGQKRLAQFAVAICGQPRILFLDEPSVGLDVQARTTLWASIRTLLASGCSIVLTTHYLEEAEALADRVAVVAKGKVIASGTVDDMRAIVSRRQIACESDIPLDKVRGWPGVVDASRDHKRLLITATDAEGVVRRLLATDSTLGRLEVRQAGLNEAFTELTREAA